MNEKTKLMKRPYHKGVKLNKVDRSIIHSLETVVEGIAEAFGTNCEVSLYSLEDLSRSCVKIENAYVTGRSAGCPLPSLGVEVLEQAGSINCDVIGNYYGRAENGRPLKNVAMLIRNAAGKPISILCVHIDLSVPLIDFVKGFLSTGEESTLNGEGVVLRNVAESFPATVNDLVNKTVKTVIDLIGQKKTSTSEKNKAIVRELYKRGMFDVKGVIDMAAKEMGISRFTVYNYIREAKLEVD